MSQKCSLLFQIDSFLPCHDLQQYTVSRSCWVWLTSLFGKSSKKGPILLKANNKLEHVVRKDVKNSEKFNFSIRKILFLDNSWNYQLNHSPTELLNCMVQPGFWFILETMFQYNLKNTKHISDWKATCFFLVIMSLLSIKVKMLTYSIFLLLQMWWLLFHLYRLLTELKVLYTTSL